MKGVEEVKEAEEEVKEEEVEEEEAVLGFPRNLVALEGLAA